MSTAEILSAQAQGGPAAVQAYQAAQAEIGARQQAAIASMQGDAVARHSPGVGEMTSQANIGYDALLNQVATLQANAGSEAASRAGRMADYSKQAAMAGAMIPAQAAAEASLIRAQGDTDLQRIRAEGTNKLEESRLNFDLSRQQREQEQRDKVEYIKWQMRQQSAADKAKAAKDAAEANTPTKAELEAMAVLRARDSLGGNLATAKANAAKAPAPYAEDARATKQANGTFLLNPAIAGQHKLTPTSEQIKEYEDFTGKSAKGLSRDQVMKVIGGVNAPGDTDAIKAQNAKEIAAAKAKAEARRKDQLLGTKQRRKADYDLNAAETAYNDPIAMRNAVGNAASSLAREGYTVTPEMLAVLLGGQFLSGSQYDARDSGLPYTPEMQYAAANRNAKMTGLANDGYDDVRTQVAQTAGVDFDSIVESAGVSKDAAAAYLLGEQGSVSDDLKAVDEFLADNEDASSTEVNNFIRGLGLTPGQEKILRELKGL